MELDELPQPTFEGAVEPAELRVDGDNPNEMADEMFDLLVDNIEENGWLGGPVITDADGLIADGEHRWRAAQEADLDAVPVRQFDLDDETRRLWRLELNKIHGEHDKKRDALEYDLLLDRGKRDDVMELTRATGEDIDELLASIRPETTPKHPDYEYNIDPNVYYQDCIEGMREHLDDNSVDFVFTSPPYNVGLAASDNPETEAYDAYEDEMDPEEYREFIGEVLDELARVVKPDGHIFFNIHIDIRDGTVTTHEWLCERMSVPWRSYVVWNKRNSSRAITTMQENGRFLQSWEPVYHFSEEPEPLPGSRNFGVWDIDQSQYESEHDTGTHPAPFPVGLVRHAIEPTTDEGDLVLDPFMGSGTTAVAAIETGRQYVGFELDADGHYKPTIERRVREALRQTGQLDPSHDDVADPAAPDADD